MDFLTIVIDLYNTLYYFFAREIAVRRKII